MTEKKMGSLMTVQPLLTQLIESGKILILKDSPTGRDHRLILNNVNVFNRIYAQIDNIENLSNRVSEAASKDISALKETNVRFKDPSLIEFQSHFIHLLQLFQLYLYGKSTGIAQKIEQNIKSKEDRNMLNNQLPKILLMSEGLNRTIMPEVNKETKELLQYVENQQRIIKDYHVSNTIFQIKFLMKDSKG
jgi:hypothetical protein